MRKVRRNRTHGTVARKDRAVTAEGTPKVLVDCCYCLSTNYVDEPPCLVDCIKCGRPFRVLRDLRGGGSKMELSKNALGHYARTDRSA